MPTTPANSTSFQDNFLPFCILGPKTPGRQPPGIGISPNLNYSEEGMLTIDRLELEEGPAPPRTAQCECGT